MHADRQAVLDANIHPDHHGMIHAFAYQMMAPHLIQENHATIRAALVAIPDTMYRQLVKCRLLQLYNA